VYQNNEQELMKMLSIVYEQEKKKRRVESTCPNVSKAGIEWYKMRKKKINSMQQASSCTNCI